MVLSHQICIVLVVVVLCFSASDAQYFSSHELSSLSRNGKSLIEESEMKKEPASRSPSQRITKKQLSLLEEELASLKIVRDLFMADSLKSRMRPRGYGGGDKQLVN